MAFEHKSGGWQVADRVGAIASFLCAVHCAVLPFVLALLPFVGLGFLADHRFERIFVLFACGLATLALGRGFRRNQEPLPLLPDPEPEEPPRPLDQISEQSRGSRSPGS